MTTELIKIQSYISVALANKLIEYKNKHRLKSNSETISAILYNFFGCLSDASNDMPTQQTLESRVEYLEDTILSLNNRIELLEREKEACEFLTEVDHCKVLAEALPDSSKIYPSISVSTVPKEQNEKNYPSALSNNLDKEQPLALSIGKLSFELLDDSLGDSLGEKQSEAALETFTAEMLKGISASALVQRLKTSSATLRKYLRDSSQIRWAVERDPNQLGWIYEPLLQRYYPVQVNADGSVHAVELSDLATINSCRVVALEAEQARR